MAAGVRRARAHDVRACCGHYWRPQHALCSRVLPGECHLPTLGNKSTTTSRGDPSIMEENTLGTTTLEVGSSESHELPNSSWMGPSGSGDPHGVGGTRSCALSFGKKSLHTSRSVFHTQIALHGATFGRSICCWRARVGPAQSRMPPRLVLARRPSIL